MTTSADKVTAILDSLNSEEGIAGDFVRECEGHLMDSPIFVKNIRFMLISSLLAGPEAAVLTAAIWGFILGRRYEESEAMERAFK